MFRAMPLRKVVLMAAFALLQSGCGGGNQNYFTEATNPSRVASQNEAITDNAVSATLSNEPSCIVYKVTQDSVIDPKLEAVMNAAVARTQSSSRGKYTGLSIYQPTINGVPDAWYHHTIMRLVKLGKSELSIPRVDYYKIDRAEFIERLQCKGQAGIIVAERDVSLYRNSLPDALGSGVVLEASQVILIVLSRA
jgi:hypothetical protein